MFKANWIPIEEMLPEEKKYVMVTCLDYHGDTYVWLAKRVESFDDERGWCWLFADGNTDTEYGTPVYAWMPLPEPLEEKNND